MCEQVDGDQQLPFVVLVPEDVSDTPEVDKVGDTCKASGAELSNAAVALQLVEKSECVLSRDPLGQANIYIPVDAQQYPLKSRRPFVWLCEMFHRLTGRFLSRRDYEDVLNILEARAWCNPQQITANEVAWEQIERDSVALAIVMFVEQRAPLRDPFPPTYDGLTRGLLPKLKTTSVQNELRSRGIKSHLSSGTQQFGRRLRLARDLLLPVGIVVTIKHKENGSHCRIEVGPNYFNDGLKEVASSPSSTSSALVPYQEPPL